MKFYRRKQKNFNNENNEIKNNCTCKLSILIGGLFLLNLSLAGCKKDDTSTITGDLQVVPRDPAYPGCYQVVGTNQTRCWDSAGNIITPVLGDAFFGQDAQFTHITPVYTKSSDGLTVKDEVTV